MGTYQMGNLDIDGIIILKLTLQEYVMGMWIGFSWLVQFLLRVRQM
jgi:hypothetical protein